MLFSGSFARACGALVLVSACGGDGVTTTSAAASTPAPAWRDVARVNVLCLVQSDAGVDRGPLHDHICNSVLAASAPGAPGPVRIIAAGDPALLSPDSVTLLVHAWVQADSRGRLLVFSIRPFRNSNEPMLFSAPPRAVPLAGSAGRAPELEAALGAALAETLPWLSRPAGARPIR